MRKELIITKPKKVLLIEENDADVFLYKTILKVMNIQPSIANTIKEGIEELKKGKFDIVLLDLNLPDSDGLDTIKSVINLAENIIVLTGNRDPLIKKEAFKLGVKDYLEKGRTISEKFVDILK